MPCQIKATEFNTHFFFLLLLILSSSPLLSSSVSSQQSATRKPTVFAQRGDDVSFTWQLPDALKDTVLVVSFSTHSNVIFFASTSAAANGTAVVTHRYSHRTDVTLRLQQGLVEFTLRDVGARDAGPYICMRGLTAADVVEACGQTLVVVGQWRDYCAFAHFLFVHFSSATIS